MLMSCRLNWRVCWPCTGLHWLLDCADHRIALDAAGFCRIALLDASNGHVVMSCGWHGSSRRSIVWIAVNLVKCALNGAC